MPADNLISITLTAEEKAEITAAINTLKTKLQPKLLSLTVPERQGLAKMSDKTVSFVEKSLAYAKTNPEFAPPYLTVAELETDLEGVKLLTEFENPLEQVLSGLNDSIMLAGSEAYTASLTYYNSVKQAAKQNVPNAKVIYEDLRARFPQKGKKTNNEPAQ
ncbi:MAG: hypothetical protein WCZ90_02475 [Melioribacteraceae bacterium]